MSVKRTWRQQQALAKTIIKTQPFKRNIPNSWAGQQTDYKASVVVIQLAWHNLHSHDHHMRMPSSRIQMKEALIPSIRKISTWFL